MAINQSCYGLRGRGGYGAYFTYFSTRRVVEALRQRSHGSVFDTITRRTFEGLEVAAPPPAAAARFEVDVRPYLHRILTNLLESETLAELRDTLLPKLISGEVRVRAIAE
jgi:type I restriction enzyme S subunit